MVIFDTTSMSRTRFLHSPSTSQQNPSGECASYRDAHLVSRIAKLHVLTKCMDHPSNLSLLLYLERYVQILETL